MTATSPASATTTSRPLGIPGSEALSQRHRKPSITNDPLDITWWEAVLLDRQLTEDIVPSGQEAHFFPIHNLPTMPDQCRILSPSLAVSHDLSYKPDRLNVYCDAKGRVYDVRFG